MGKKLTNNLKLKILSVFLAFFVWLAVTNISNPEALAEKICTDIEKIDKAAGFFAVITNEVGSDGGNV